LLAILNRIRRALINFYRELIESTPSYSTIKFLEMLNAKQSEEIEYLRIQNKQLLEKILEKKEKIIAVTSEDYEPIGKGYVKLSDRIMELEQQSAADYWAGIDAAKES
jgi:uncharacterized coiled-coil protein SlyX